MFFCICSVNLTCVSGKKKKLKMLEADVEEHRPVNTLMGVSLIHHCRHTWNMSYFPPKTTRGTGNGSMYSLSCNRKPYWDYNHSSTHPLCHLQFDFRIQTRLIQSTFLYNISFRSTFKWYSHLCLGLPVSFAPLCFLNKVLYACLISPVWATGIAYYIFNFSFSFLCSMSCLSSIPKYLQAFLGSSCLMSFSNVLSMYIFLWTLPLFKQILHIFLIQSIY